MNPMHFGDERIDQIRMGSSALTPEERQYLVTDTPTFEECQHTEEQLRAMSDPDLMTSAYWVWAEYASGQI